MVILDKATMSCGVGAMNSAQVLAECFDLLDALVKQLCSDDTPVAPVPYLVHRKYVAIRKNPGYLCRLYVIFVPEKCLSESPAIWWKLFLPSAQASGIIRKQNVDLGII
jgi:hypothetical protein